MDITLLFAQVFGLYLVISGVFVLIKQEKAISIAKMFGHESALRLSMGLLTTLGGLFMTLAYYDFSSAASSIITVVGWLILGKGLFFTLGTDGQINRLIGAVGGAKAYMAWGIVALLLGFYLASVGFGFMM